MPKARITKKKEQKHVIWTLCSARGQRGLTLIIGVTEGGLTYLKAGSHDVPVLVVTPDDALHVAEVVLFYGKDMATLERIIADQGWLVEEEDDES